VRRLFNDSGASPSSAFGAHVSINEVPGSGSSCQYALRITGGGECPCAGTHRVGTPHCQWSSRAFGADSSINGVPSGGPSCHNALQINRRGEGPGLRGPDSSLCGLSDQAVHKAHDSQASTGGTLGGGVPPCRHAVLSARGGERPGMRGPDTPHRGLIASHPAHIARRGECPGATRGPDAPACKVLPETTSG